MNYAFMSFSTPELTLAETLTLAKTLGYVGIEPRTASKHKHGIELTSSAAKRATIRAQVADSGIDLCCLAVSCRYADPATVDAQVAETRQYLDLAAAVGAPRLRVFGGKIPEGVSRTAALDGVAQALAALAPQAADRGVTICLETHDDWCDPAHVAAVMTQVDHPAVAVNWDIMHPVRSAGQSMDSAFATLQPWIRHVHIHDGSLAKDKLQFLPIGTGGYDHRRALELLQNAGYTGYLSGEWINWEPPLTHLPRELAAMRAYEIGD